MHAVINRLSLKADTNWTEFAAQCDVFNAMPSDPEYHGLSLVRTGENEAVLIVLFATLTALEQVSKEIAGPWFAEHLRPFLSGPPQRSVGEIIAGGFGAQI